MHLYDGDENERAEPLLTTSRDCGGSIKARIAALDPVGERSRQEEALIAAFPDLPGLANAAQTVLLIVAALPEEPRTVELFRIAVTRRRKELFCPRVDRRIAVVEPPPQLPTRRPSSSRGYSASPSRVRACPRSPGRDRLGARPGPCL